MPYLTQNIGAEEWTSFLIERLTRESVLLASGARRIIINGKSMHVPIAAPASTDWYAELEEIDADDAAPTEVELVPRKVSNLTVASNEAVGDAAVDVLDGIGTVAMQAVALKADLGLFAGTGTAPQPRGLLNISTVPKNTALDPTYAGLVTAAGTIRAAGGKPDVAYINPVDHTALSLQSDGDDRPLLQATDSGPAEMVGGLRLWPTTGVPAGVAIVAEAWQILVGVRDDPRVDISTDAKFGADATVVRTIARVDVGVANPAGLLIIGE